MEKKFELSPSNNKRRWRTKEEITEEKERVYARAEVTKVLEGFGVPDNKFLEILNVGDVVDIENFTEQNVSGIEVECLGITYSAEKKGAVWPKYTIIKTPFEKGAQFQYIRPSKSGNFGQMI